MKSVLISIQPKWCELIASGKKTVEVRKTRPKIETPFKVYIYCTKQKVNGEILLTFDKKVEGRNRGFRDNGDIAITGKVIGEFVCDTFITDKTFGHDALFNAAACMNYAEVAAYCTNNDMYGWHISDLVIYEKPRALSEFRKPVDCHRGKQRFDCEGCWDCEIKRPPQSWCYVEEG